MSVDYPPDLHNSPFSNLIGPDDVTDIYRVTHGDTVESAYARLLASLEAEFPAWEAARAARGFRMMPVPPVPETDAATVAAQYLSTSDATPAAAADPWRVVPVRADPQSLRPVLPAYLFFAWVSQP
jgi:hypothetical protein